jgi:hypothetical protein
VFRVHFAPPLLGSCSTSFCRPRQASHFRRFMVPRVQQLCSQPCRPLKPTYETRRPSSSNQGFFTQETRSGSVRVTLKFRPPTATVKSAVERAASKISFHDATIFAAISVGGNLLLLLTKSCNRSHDETICCLWARSSIPSPRRLLMHSGHNLASTTLHTAQ